jgi:hypothetical protein
MLETRLHKVPFNFFSDDRWFAAHRDEPIQELGRHVVPMRI